MGRRTSPGWRRQGLAGSTGRRWRETYLSLTPKGTDLIHRFYMARSFGVRRLVAALSCRWDYPQPKRATSRRTPNRPALLYHLWMKKLLLLLLLLALPLSAKMKV